MAKKRSTRKRISSPAGIDERLATRLATYKAEIPKGGSGTQHHNKPGSRNRRKVGR